MIDIDISKIIEDLGKKDTEELLKIAFTEPGDYIKEVSDSAKKELVKRRINKDSDIVQTQLQELELKKLKENTGIAGWLVMPAIGLIITPLIVILIGHETLYDLLLDIVYIAFNIYVALLFFKKF